MTQYSLYGLWLKFRRSVSGINSLMLRCVLTERRASNSDPTVIPLVRRSYAS
jgi:hypothetical protein